MRLLFPLIVLCPCLAFAQESTVDFNRDVLPVLSDKCFRCHGPDGETREAELRLDTREGLLGDRGGYKPFVAGKPDESEALRRITTDDPDERMPPPKSSLQLSADEIALIRRWVEEGAEWKQHWSFAPVARIEPPATSRPDWCRNPIDNFILTRLDREKLAPSPEAEKTTLIRRVTLDLTGLPPTPAEVDAFLADDSTDAYEKVVDRLLKSPRYGERMALMWLDAARYADTDGYQNDGPRAMWRWRDWVIDAYNANLPFDRFTIEQLAGDLLPNATLDQRIATGFNRNHRYNSEAGLVLEEFLLENAVDRVDTSSTVWMGLTMGCARCHEHKFDPISQREYYQLIAFFDNVSESGRAVKFGNSEPWVVAPTAAQQETLAAHDDKLRAAEAALEAAEDEITKAQHAWQQRTGERTSNPQAPEQEPVVVARGMTHHFPLDNETPEAKPEQGSPTYVDGVVGNAIELDGKSVLALGKAGDVACQTRSSIAFWLSPDDLQQGVVLSRQAGGTTRPGVTVELRDGRLQFFIITRWVAGVGAIETAAPLEAGKWVHVCLTNDGSQSARGMKIHLDGREVATRTLYNTNSNTGGTNANAVLRLGGGVYGGKFTGRIDELRFYNRTLWDDEVALLAVPETIDQIVQTPEDKRSQQQREKLRTWYLEHAAPPKLRKLGDAYFAARTARLKFWDSLPTTMVMDELDPPRPTHVRIRGAYNVLGDEVSPDVPSSFPRMPADYPRNRLGFARWLISGEHPLTARVAVNRYWQKYFGVGLVKTAEDFGMQGEPPSHPELLDWLASEFVRSGWDVKAMQRLIVTSAAYRQSSHVTPKLNLRDPENRLVARGPRQRLPAHVLRDQALFVSGLLVEQQGGPSVSPYQPEGLWESLSNMKYRQSKGNDLYRRSLYTIWKRTVVPPSLAILDAADRESCIVRPKRTNTPLQALTLLNETGFVEAARKLGERMLLEGDDGKIEFAFRLVAARTPRPAERKLLERAYTDYLAEYKRDPAAARKLIAVGESKPAAKLDPIELAACTALANVLLNLDEVVTKE